jgi:hypothetical protein
MPRDSKRKRHLRRVRRDRTLAYRMVNQLLAEREMSRKIITGMAATIEKLETPKTEETPRADQTSE